MEPEGGDAQREVEAFVARRHGGGELEERKRKAELAKVVREIRRLKREIEQLEIRQAELELPRPRQDPRSNREREG